METTQFHLSNNYGEFIELLFLFPIKDFLTIGKINTCLAHTDIIGYLHRRTFEMKKIIVLLISVGLLLVACSNNEQNDGNDVVNDDVIEIWFIRHGKTWFNTTEQVQGFADTPLTQEGLDAAKKAGESLKDVKFDLAYAGKLGRQINTLKILLEENENDVPEIKEHIGFNEWNYGGFEGKTNQEMWDAIGKDHGYTYDENWEFYEGLFEVLGDKGIADELAKVDPWNEAETYDEITKRANEAMEELISEAQKTGAKRVLIVSSGSMIPTILKEISPESYNGESIGNLGLTKIEYKNGVYDVKTIGDLDYIK